MQARRRYPNVPFEIVKWAVDNIADPRELQKGLSRIEQERRVRLRYAS
jgi:hypothetical protein